MPATVIIPARYASSRLPGKPLLDRTGKCLLQHVVDAVRPAGRVDRVVVATDDERIAEAVRAFGGEVVMTSEDCASGTDRVAEAAATLELPADHVVVDVQGDEPEIPAQLIDQVIALIESGPAPMATLAAPLAADQAGDPNRVKVVCDLEGHAMYFSRAVIPFDRDHTGRLEYLLHLGLYAYRAEFLSVLTSLPPTPAEQTEKLEQLRALQHGFKIAVARAGASYSGSGIDTPEDYAAFVARWKQREG